MRKLEKAQKIGITCAILCCALLTLVFSADYKKLFASVTDALNALTGTEATMTVDSMVVMNTEDAQQTDDYYAFGVYAPSTATYTIGVTADNSANGKVRVNTGAATAVAGTEVSVSLTEGTNVLYFVDCENLSIQWDSEVCDLEPINKVCMPLSGDVNQSENRTVEDLVLIKREAAVTGSGNMERTEIADIDGSDSVTDDDASLLRTLMVGNPEYEVAERCPLIVDAYIEETGTLYDTLADAIEAASEISVSDSKEVTVTVLNPTDVKLVRNAEYLENQKKYISIPVTDGAQIELKDDGSKDSGWCRTLTRGSTENFKMFAIGKNASLTLTGSSESDVNSSLIVDGGAKANNGNHIVDVGNTLGAETAKLTMNAGVKITNNENNGSSSSGGALAVKGTFNMNGGVISGNTAKGTGGAINLLSGSVMNMAGGIITENETKTETSSGGGINVSGGATLVMEGGKVYGNISPVSVGNNSVRVSGETSVLKMGGSAYIDRVCIDTASSVTPYIELTSTLTTTEPITLFFPQPLNKTGNVVRRDSSCAASDSIFQLSERMLPCTLVQDDSNENLCLKSSTEGMEKIKASIVYSNYGFDDDTWAVQGVCSDGTYLYAAIEQEKTVGVTFNGCKILKVKLDTWETVAISELLPTDHSNEMTYNPNTGKIYITHCMSSGEFEETTGFNKDNGPYAVSVVDPSDLDKVERVIQLSDTAAYTGTTGIYGLAYNNSRGYYVAGCTGFRFGFLADSGEIGNEDYTIKETTMLSTGMAGFSGYTSYTKQGVYANDTTIYTNNWNDKDKMNLITMYDWRGNYNGTKYVVEQNGNAFTQESESMFEYNGDMYMACIPIGHKGVDIYKLDDVGKVASPIDVKDANGVVVDDGYVNLADAITKANELEIATIVLKEDVIISTTQTITGNVTITDDGTKRTLRRSTGCKNEMFNVADGAELTFTSSSENDNNPMLVIDGNKANVTTTNYAPVVHMNQTNGILNIKPGVIVQNNKSHASGGIVFAGKNDITSAGGGQATINITGGLFTGNEIEYSSSKYLFGGCIYIESGCTLNISNATFANTKMVQDATDGMTYGGVISARTSTAQQNGDKGASITLEDCVFKNTSVTQKGSASANGGGVLYLRDQNPGSVQIINCEFLDNSTKGSGGAIYMGNTKTPIELSGCSFSNNTDANGTNDIYMVASTNVNVSGDTQANIKCAGTEQIHITENLGTESVIRVDVSGATAGTTVATFASTDIMTACKENRNIVLSDTGYALSYDATNLNATLVEAVAVVEDSGYASLADAIEAASTIESDAENPVVIILISDTVSINSVTKIPTGTFVEIIDDGMKRTLQRTSGCTAEMFNVAGGAGLTFTSSSKDDKYPLLVIDGNMANVTTSGTSPIVKMNNTNGILNITPGVIVQNNKSANAGGVIYAGTNSGGSSGGGLASINITGGLFTGNKIVNTGQWIFGGCIYIESGCTLNICNATFEETTMETTHKSGYTYGGVISVRTNAAHPYDGADVSIENCIFENTTVTQKGSGNGGGVLYIGGGNSGTVQITNCTFNNNTTDGLGGAIHTINTDAAFNLFGCSFSNNTDANGANDIQMVEGTNVNISGNTQANIRCVGTGKMNITGELGIDSVINVSVSNATVGNTVASFANAELLNACKDNRNIVLSDTSYALSYDATNLKATLESAVAVVEDKGYLSLAEAIEVANALESATIVLKADVTVGETQIITGNVTITDDGTARLLTRGERLTDAMFDIVDTDTATGNLTIVGTQQGTITVDGNRDVVTATDSMIKNGGTFTLGTNASLTNAGNTNVEKGGALYNTGTATLAGTLSGNKANQGGALYSEDGTVTISGGTFELNSANQGGVVYTAIGATLNITGGTFGTEGKGNTSTYRAGVVYVQESTSTEEIASATISNATFSYNVSNNSTGASGGVLYVGTYADVEIAKCTFNNNSVTCSKSGLNAYGGAIYVTDANVSISDSWFSNNSTERGGAVYIAKASELTLHNCEFEDNAATNLGRDIFYDNGKLTLSGKVGNAQIDKRQHTINVVGELDSTSDIEIMQVSGTIGLAQVQFESVSATEIGEQCISYYDYYSNGNTIINSGKTLQFDTETCQAIMR